MFFSKRNKRSAVSWREKFQISSCCTMSMKRSGVGRVRQMLVSAPVVQNPSERSGCGASGFCTTNRHI
ncbi:MAG: hypothetical protein WC682_04265 [Parcubacteria group bacterium]